MAEHKLDFHGTFRTLCTFRPSADEAQRNLLIDRLIAQCGTPHNLDIAKATEDWKVWLNKYTARIESESDHWGKDGGNPEGERKQEMRGANPRFVLRQWVLEEIIRNVERDVHCGKRLLAKVLQVSSPAFMRLQMSLIDSIDRCHVTPSTPGALKTTKTSQPWTPNRRKSADTVGLAT